MTILEAIQSRHAVRSYRDIPLNRETVQAIQDEVDACNRESGLHIQLITDEPRAFESFMAHYGKFAGVRNYIALIGKKEPKLDERVGYYGERLALFAQTLGLNTCWVAMSFSKRTVKNACTVASGEKLVCVLSLGYGATQGVPHKNKPVEELSCAQPPVPEWFCKGMEATQLAPTAMNQQKFRITLHNGAVSVKSLGGLYSNVDLGIVKYHFEAGAGKENFTWAE